MEGVGGWGGQVLGGQGGCERRIEVFVKIQKKIGGGGGVQEGVGFGGLRLDVNEELKFLGKFKKKFEGGGGGWRGPGGGGGSGWRGGQGGCERRIEVLVKIKNFFFFFFFWGGGGGGGGGGSGWVWGGGGGQVGCE